ncbi:hypothetical protein C8R46DRAFT_1215399 [Mycena filopes]|nr:hypothetical protein C8R46DRAFT_1215399 [Mycena filopes]
MPKLLCQFLTRSYSSSAGAEATKSRLRSLLRETAQPVAVVTSFMSPDASHRSGENDHSKPMFHGATLSSFTSIAMDPVPLVTFALRIPSRMASSLNSSPVEFTFGHGHKPFVCKPGIGCDAVLAPRPPPASILYDPIFPERGRDTGHSRIARRYFVQIGVERSSPPRSPLSSRGDSKNQHRRPAHTSTGIVSELFIAQVTRVEALDISGEEDDALPLLYHRRSSECRKLTSELALIGADSKGTSPSFIPDFRT